MLLLLWQVIKVDGAGIPLESAVSATAVVPLLLGLLSSSRRQGDSVVEGRRIAVEKGMLLGLAYCTCTSVKPLAPWSCGMHSRTWQGGARKTGLCSTHTHAHTSEHSPMLHPHLMLLPLQSEDARGARYQCGPLAFEIGGGRGGGGPGGPDAPGGPGSGAHASVAGVRARQGRRLCFPADEP